MNSEEIKKDQSFYDNLLKLSDAAFEMSGRIELHEQYKGKSEAYDWAAQLFDLHCAVKGINLKTKNSKRQLEVKEMQNLEIKEMQNHKS